MHVRANTMHLSVVPGARGEIANPCTLDPVKRSVFALLFHRQFFLGCAMSVNDRDREAHPGPISPPTGRGGGFADLARLGHQTADPNGTQPSTERRSENSGIIDLAALAAAEEKATPAAQAPAPAVDAIGDAIAAKVPAAAPAKTTRTSRIPLWAAFLLGAIVALGAVAFVLFLRRGQSEGRRDGTSPARSDVVVMQNAVSPVRVVAPAASVQDAAGSNGERTFDFSQLPPMPASIGGGVPSAAGEPPEAPSGSAATHAAVPVPAAGASALRAAGRAGSGSEKGLDALMQEAVGAMAASAPPRPTTAPDDTTSTANAGVPFRPSQGAINGALGIALPSARACLETDSPISRATITFRSDGAVSDVVVEGWAAGKPAEACIRAALGKARVPPFAQPIYSVPATIRSN
jgi:hypothetical protein